MRPTGNSNWVKIYDDSFIVKAFIYNRKYASSGCKLYLINYNEYILIKTKDICDIAMKLKTERVFDGI